MIVSQSKKFIFVHVHKAGGSSVSTALQPHLAWNDLILGGSELGETLNPLFRAQYGLHKHSTFDEIRQVIGDTLVDDYFSFAFVREPSAKIVSLYNYIASFSEDLARFLGKTEDELAEASISGSSDISHNFLSWDATRAYYQTGSFSDFIRSADAQADMGFRPQIDSLKTPDGDRIVNKIVKLETVMQSLPELWQGLGFRFHLPHVNRAEKIAQSHETMEKRDKAYLKALFADDYLALEYPG